MRFNAANITFHCVQTVRARTSEIDKAIEEIIDVAGIINMVGGGRTCTRNDEHANRNGEREIKIKVERARE